MYPYTPIKKVVKLVLNIMFVLKTKTNLQMQKTNQNETKFYNVVLTGNGEKKQKKSTPNLCMSKSDI